MSFINRLFGKKDPQRQPVDREQFLNAFVQFVNARTWDASRGIVEQHPELLSAETELCSVLDLLPGHGMWTAYGEQATTDALWQALPATMWDVTDSLTAAFAAAFYEATLHNPWPDAGIGRLRRAPAARHTLHTKRGWSVDTHSRHET